MLPDVRCQLVQAQSGVFPWSLEEQQLRRAAETDNGSQQRGIIRIKYTPGRQASVPAAGEKGGDACCSQCDDFTLLKVRPLWVQQQPLWQPHSSPQHQHCLQHLNFSQGQLGCSAQWERKLRICAGAELEVQTWCCEEGRSQWGEIIRGGEEEAHNSNALQQHHTASSLHIQHQTTTSYLKHNQTLPVK